jgi:hypothetical protein
MGGCSFKVGDATGVAMVPDAAEQGNAGGVINSYSRAEGARLIRGERGRIIDGRLLIRGAVAIIETCGFWRSTSTRARERTTHARSCKQAVDSGCPVAIERSRSGNGRSLRPSSELMR